MTGLHHFGRSLQQRLPWRQTKGSLYNRLHRLSSSYVHTYTAPLVLHQVQRHNFSSVSTVPSLDSNTKQQGSSIPKSKTGVDLETRVLNSESQHDDDLFKNCVARIDIEGRSADEIWEEYLALFDDPQVTLEPFDFLTVCMALKRDKTGQQSIKRMQVLLRHIHQRGDMPEVFTRCCNTLMHVYLELGDLNSARLVFDGMLRSKYKPTGVTVCILLGGIGQWGTAKDALTLYHTLSKKRLFPERLGPYHRLMLVLGLQFGDWHSCVKLMDKLLESETLRPDTSIFNTMLHIYSVAKQPDQAWKLYTRMKEQHDIRPNEGTYYYLISALRSTSTTDAELKNIGTERIQELYADMQKLGITIRASHYIGMGWDPQTTLAEIKKKGVARSVFDYNTLISHAVKNNDFDVALNLYQQMVQEGTDGDDSHPALLPDIYTYGIVMNAIVKDITQPPTMVYEIYEEMKKLGVQPDVVVYGSMLMACAREGDVQRAVGYLHEMQDRKVEPNLYILNSFFGVLTRSPTKDKQHMYVARALWDQMIDKRLYPDTRAYNQYLMLLSRYVPVVDPSEYKASLSLQQEDLQFTLQQIQSPDGDNIDLYREDASDIGGTMSGTAKYMMKLYKDMRRSRKRCHPDFISYSIMINTLVAHGQTRLAMSLYRDAHLADVRLGVHLYNSILRGLRRDSELNQIMLVWQDMKAHNTWPDRTTYDLVLDACEQLQLVESFTSIIKQQQADSKRLEQLEAESEERWKKASFYKQKYGQSH